MPSILITCSVALFMLTYTNQYNVENKIHKLNLGSNAYVIEAESSLILIDAGYPGKEDIVIEKLQSLEPKKLVLIFLTHGHFDHYGSALAIKKQTGADIGIHALDSLAVVQGETPVSKTKNGGQFGKAILPIAEFIYRHKPSVVDVTFKDGDNLSSYGISAVVVHTPGHTPGSCCLMLDSKILFCGDLISTQFGVQKQKWYADDWDEIDKSILKLQQLRPALLYPGHGKEDINLVELLLLKGKP